MADENTTAYARVQIAGINVTSTIQSIDVEDHDRAIDKVTIVLDDTRETASDIVNLDQVVLVDLGWATEHAVLFEGIVTRVETAAQGNARQRVTVTAYDLSYRLRRGAPTSANHVGRLSVILDRIVTRQPHGFTVGRISPDPDPEFTDDEPLRQTNQLDWDFIQTLATRYGARAFIEYNEGSKFYFVSERELLQGEPMGALVYCAGFRQLIEFEYHRVGSGASPTTSATTVDPRSGEVITRTADPAPPAPPPTADTGTRARIAQESSSDASRYDAAVQVGAESSTTADQQRPQRTAAGGPSGEAAAEQAIRRDPTRVLGLQGTGQAIGTVHLRAKGKVTISGIAPWAAGDWYVTQVNHLYARSVSGARVSSTYRSNFSATR